MPTESLGDLLLAVSVATGLVLLYISHRRKT